MVGLLAASRRKRKQNNKQEKEREKSSALQDWTISKKKSLDPLEFKTLSDWQESLDT